MAFMWALETDENGEDLFVPIEDDELMDKVFAKYNRLVEEEENCGCGCGCDGGCDCGNH